MRAASGWVLGVALAAACVACGETSLVIGGDPEQQTLVAAGAAAGVGAGGAGAGAVGPGVGGAGIGGSLSLSAGGEAAGTGPYPPVHWENGRADASYCPDAGVLGITCVHVDRETTACDPNGEPSCNGCACVRACESSADCESGSNGAAGTCVPLADGSSSCFLSCENGGCPLGMVCIPHPNDGSAVCVWVPSDSSNMVPVR